MRDFHGHVVELCEKPEPVEVSEDEARMIFDALYGYYPAEEIADYAKAHGELRKEQSRLMRAYINGYTVKKPKRWNVNVPKKWSGDDKHYWTKEQDGALTLAYLINNDYMIPAHQFTLAEIEHYGLQDCERVEVTDDEQ